MNDEGKPDPDYGSSLVWSTENSAAVGAATLLKKHSGNVDNALRALFGHSCDYSSARLYAEALAAHFGLTVIDFMKKWRLWKKGQL